MRASLPPRVLILILILLFAGCGRGIRGASQVQGESTTTPLPLPPESRSIQKANCFPSESDASAWPVKAIYLHGLFSPNSDTDYYGSLEEKNRKYLQALARRMHFRIAVPVSDSLSPQGYRYWNVLSLEKIENMASQACGGAPLTPQRALIGFSNGGYAARRISYLECRTTAPYVKLLAIGFPENDSGNCGNYVHVVPHVFPPADPQFFDTQLAGLAVIMRGLAEAPRQ